MQNTHILIIEFRNHLHRMIISGILSSGEARHFKYELLTRYVIRYFCLTNYPPFILAYL